MAENQSHLSVTERDGIKIVEFSDRKILDEVSIAEIRDELSQLVGGADGIKLLLCFKDVEHLSSAALGALITVNKQVADAKGVLKLSDIAPPIYEVFKITRLNKLFDIHDTAAKALGDF